jgi:hypothetical protein
MEVQNRFAGENFEDFLYAINLHSIWHYYVCATINTSAQWLAYQQKELKNCPYIFEGKVISQQKNGGSTCSVIQDTQIYRGTELKVGTIKVITTMLSGAEKFPQLHNGDSYIIFGNLNNSDSFSTVSADNSTIIISNDWVTLNGTGATWGWRRVSTYPTMDSLYSFFRNNGVTVQEEAPTGGVK